MRQSKAKLRAEINRLRQRQRSIEQFLSGLIQPEHWEHAPAHIRSAENGEGSSKWFHLGLPSNSCAADGRIKSGIGPVSRLSQGDPVSFDATIIKDGTAGPVAAQQLVGLVILIKVAVLEE